MEHIVIFMNVAVTGILIGLVWCDWRSRQEALREIKSFAESWRADVETYRAVHNSLVEQVKTLSDRVNVQEFRAHQAASKGKIL
jgi:hypothetical protein